MVRLLSEIKCCENILKRFLVCRCYGRLDLGGWGGALDFFYVLGTKSPDTALCLSSHFRSVVLKWGRWVEVVWEREQILLPLNIQQYLGTFLVVTISDTIWHLVCRDQGRLPNTLPNAHNTSTTKNHPAPNVIDAEVERTCLSLLDDKAKW